MLEFYISGLFNGKICAALEKARATLAEERLAERISCKTREAVELSSRRKDLLGILLTSSKFHMEIWIMLILEMWNHADSGHDDQSSISSRVVSMSNIETNRKRGMVLQFQPLSLAFDDIRYSIKMPQVSTSYWLSVSPSQVTLLFKLDFLISTESLVFKHWWCLACKCCS